MPAVIQPEPVEEVNPEVVQAITDLMDQYGRAEVVKAIKRESSKEAKLRQFKREKARYERQVEALDQAIAEIEAE